VQAARSSLRSNFAWTFAGTAANGVSQWAILSLLAKFASTEALGQYAFGAAIAAPIAMLAHLNLRAVIATDVAARHPFGDYLAVRLIASGIGIAVVSAVALTHDSQRAAATVLIGLSFTIEAFSDLYFGVMQRNDRMDLIGRSMIIRSTLTIVLLLAAVLSRPDVVYATAALVVARLSVLLLHDWPCSNPPAAQLKQPWDIARAAMPLGAVLMLTSLTTNMPRYAIEQHLGTVPLGVFAAVASFITIGSTVIIAMGQSVTTRLAVLYTEHRFPEFRSLVLRLVGFATALGAAGVIGAIAVGPILLGALYRPEYASYQTLLIEMMIAGIFVYVAVILGFAVTSTRRFTAQMPLLACVTAGSVVAAYTAVPHFGLTGAAISIAFAASIQIAGQVLILVRAL
jgi:O-antigen/teichoic acid export membrane protein